MSSNPYEAAAGGASQVFNPMDLPPATTVLTHTIDDMKENFVSHLSAGFGMFASLFVLIFGFIVLIMVPLAPGILQEDETLLMAGGAVTVLSYTVGLALIGLVIVPSMQMSLYRAANRQVGDGIPMSIGSAFSEMSQDRWAFVGCYVLTGLCITMGTAFCYVPGIILSLVLPIAPVMVAIRGQRPLVALTTTFNFIQANPVWHLAVGALGLVGVLILSLVPILGVMLSYPFLAAYHVNTVRILMPEEG